MKRVSLGEEKWDHLPASPGRFYSWIVVLRSLSLLSSHYDWEVKVGDKPGWVLGICKAATSIKENMTLSPENGHLVETMRQQNECQACTFLQIQMEEPCWHGGISLDYKMGTSPFTKWQPNPTSLTATGYFPLGPLQPILSPRTLDGEKNMDPPTICLVGVATASLNTWHFASPFRLLVLNLESIHLTVITGFQCYGEYNQ